MIYVQYQFHLADKLGIFLWWNYPLFVLPRLKFVFFSTRRIVSCDTLSTLICSNWASRSANKRSVQRLRPSGACPHTKVVKWASSAPSSLRSYCRLLGLRFSATSRPSSTYLLRIRSTVACPTSTASQISLSCHFSFALSRIRALVNLRACSTPVEIRFSKWFRSAIDRLTSYIFLLIAHLFQ